jgi:hypothetical protein
MKRRGFWVTRILADETGGLSAERRLAREETATLDFVSKAIENPPGEA